jgi:simple sugar transport system permease protein
MIPLLVITGIASGGGFALIAGYLKADYDINPIVSTIMLNYVGFQFVNYICTAPRFLDPRGGHPQTLLLPENANLGFFNGIPHSVVLAVLCIAFVYFLINKTRLGYEINAVGYNQDAAQTYGINFRKTIMVTFAIGGAMAGLGGALEVINIHGRLLVGFAHTSGANFGALGVLTALVVVGKPIGVPVSAFLMSVLLVGADRLQRTMQVPVELVFLCQAIIVLFIVVIRAKLSGDRK